MHKRVPAVGNALAILDFLREVGNEPRTVSEIARATGLNVSTCFNILKTLEDAQVIAFEPARKTYRLGLHLAELASVIDVHAQITRQVMDEARRIAGTVGLGCFLMGLDDRAETFVVLDKIESAKQIKVTIDRGARFPITGSLASKAWFAWSTPEEIARLVAEHEMTKHTDRSITDVAVFEAELARTRECGYSTSIGEYYPGHNAVAAPVFNADGSPAFLLVVVGAEAHLGAAALDRVGAEVLAGAERATKRIGGHHPKAVSGR
ncbi:MAG: IclR family transcriptional regulator [Pseudonocardia sp.]|nr:IclR family transcriptional regulator [Pseudonocardia sp.]